MNDYHPDVVRLFHEAVPESFLRDTVQCLRAAYREAHVRCTTEFPPSEAHDIFPHLRRALFEGSWRNIASRYPEVTSEAVLNKARNCHHTEIRCGNIILTESAVPSPNTLVREARFRQSLARLNQLSLFDPEPAETLGTGAALYAILIHGGEQTVCNSPAFVHVVFPSPDCSYYVDRIDLCEMLTKTVVEPTDQQGVIDDNFDIRLKPAAVRKRENA